MEQEKLKFCKGETEEALKEIKNRAELDKGYLYHCLDTKNTFLATSNNQLVRYSSAVGQQYGASQGEVFNDYGNNQATGSHSHAEGSGCSATGDYSHAEGQSCTASKIASHAEGGSCLATGDYSHAEGCNSSTGISTTAAGKGSHAEGWGTLANGAASHAEGELTKAYAPGSHAEGQKTQAGVDDTTTDGAFSHAEGVYSKASGRGSHAEGVGTAGNEVQALSEGSHAEGISTIAHGSGSHAEGFESMAGAKKVRDNNVTTIVYNTDPNFAGAHAEGKFAAAFGTASHAEGFSTLASGLYSHAEGNGALAYGETSHAEGLNTKVDGRYSHAEGNGTCVKSQSSHAEGNRTVAGGDQGPNLDEIMKLEGSNNPGEAAHAEGIGTFAQGKASHAEGYKTIAYGAASHSEGICETTTPIKLTIKEAEKSIYTVVEPNWIPFENQIIYYKDTYTAITGRSEASRWIQVKNLPKEDIEATLLTMVSTGKGSHLEGVDTFSGGTGSHAEGSKTMAVGNHSHAEGYETKVTGAYSHAEGRKTLVSGDCSHAEGYYTTALRHQHVQGHYNKYNGLPGSDSGDSGTAFVIGNGTSDLDSDRANAFRITYNGNVHASGSFNPPGADYAEFFEWEDGNPFDEDRRGYFVTLNNDKIKIATPEDDFILGVVSGQPAIIGNSDEEWTGRYILDEFGSFISEEFEYEEKTFDSETGEEIITTKIGTKYKQNPEYDPSQVYIQRQDRSEWAAVGMLGVLSVRDDGTCQANGYCSITKDGTATMSLSGYRVIKRVNDNIVKIIFR